MASTVWTVSITCKFIIYELLMVLIITCSQGTWLSYIIDIIVIYLLLNVCLVHVKWWVESDFKAPIVVNSYTILGFAFHCLGFKHIYSQLHINGIQQQTTPIQAISFLHVQGIISLEMPVPSQGHYGFHSFPVVDWFCLFI
jgi:hypothetical protein